MWSLPFGNNLSFHNEDSEWFILRSYDLFSKSKFRTRTLFKCSPIFRPMKISNISLIFLCGSSTKNIYTTPFSSFTKHSEIWFITSILSVTVDEQPLAVLNYYVLKNRVNRNLSRRSQNLTRNIKKTTRLATKQISANMTDSKRGSNRVRVKSGYPIPNSSWEF